LKGYLSPVPRGITIKQKKEEHVVKCVMCLPDYGEGSLGEGSQVLPESTTGGWEDRSRSSWLGSSSHQSEKAPASSYSVIPSAGAARDSLIVQAPFLEMPTLGPWYL
jgi:hypothetical protein